MDPYGCISCTGSVHIDHLVWSFVLWIKVWSFLCLWWEICRSTNSNNRQNNPQYLMQDYFDVHNMWISPPRQSRRSDSCVLVWLPPQPTQSGGRCAAHRHVFCVLSRCCCGPSLTLRRKQTKGWLRGTLISLSFISIYVAVNIQQTTL